MKIGDYVRTESGKIGKVVSEPYEYKDIMGCDIKLGNGDIYNEYDLFDIISKSSPNIIDLIEVGDYVNGILVTKRMIDNLEMYFNDIKSIVTKEQFESMEYRV